MPPKIGQVAVVEHLRFDGFVRKVKPDGRDLVRLVLHLGRPATPGAQGRTDHRC